MNDSAASGGRVAPPLLYVAGLLVGLILERKFGRSYLEYKQRVRRWL